MPHLQFTDSRAICWDVWAVAPTRAERRHGRDRRHGSRPGMEERRVRREPRYHVHDQLDGGWLCFECREEKRRLAPIPAAWESLPATELERLCREARAVPRSVRRFIA